MEGVLYLIMPISDQMAALYQERLTQRDFSWAPSKLKERFMVSLRAIRQLIRESPSDCLKPLLLIYEEIS